MVEQRSRHPAGSREGGQGGEGPRARPPGLQWPVCLAGHGDSACAIRDQVDVRGHSCQALAQGSPGAQTCCPAAMVSLWSPGGGVMQVYLQASDSEWPLVYGHGGGCQGLQSSRDWRAKPGPQGRQPHGPALGPGGPVHLGAWLGALAPAVYKLWPPWPHSTEFQMGGRCRRAQGLLGPQSQASCRGTTPPSCCPVCSRLAAGSL